MKTTKILSFAGLLLVLLPSVGPVHAAETPSTAPWLSLFNGQNLTGWTPMSEGVFVVTNGCLRVVSGMGWLRSEKQYRNFALEVEWRALVPGYNSGVFVRAEQNGTPWPTNVWQVNLKDSAIGALLKGSPTVLPSKTPMKPVNQWVKFHLEARGRQLTLDVDGARVWEFNEFEPERGFLGLQAENKAIEFRSVRIQTWPE
jgi:hypothetical protein